MTYIEHLDDKLTLASLLDVHLLRLLNIILNIFHG